MSTQCGIEGRPTRGGSFQDLNQAAFSEGDITGSGTLEVLYDPVEVSALCWTLLLLTYTWLCQTIY